MKNALLIAVIATVMFSCSKSIDKPAGSIATEGSTHGEQKCDFGITKFSLSKRAPVSDDVAMRRPTTKTTVGGTGGSGGTTTTTTNNTATGGVIYLDFDGQLVSNTSWNYNGDINCAPANLTAAQINEIVMRVGNDYSPFNILVTTDEAVYNAANIYRRMRVIITESWEWYGQAGGVSYTGSFTTGSNTPCFVFSSLLSYNTKNISEAAAHEAGHTLGLRHQASYDASGVLISSYNYGQGSGEICWAPIMGVGYNRNLTIWHNGPTSAGPTSYQDDVAIITNVVGVKGDDFPDTYSNATTIPGSVEGMINRNTDVDFFAIDIASPKNISLIPFNVAAPNSGADVDLLLKVYDAQGQLITTVDDVNTLNVSTTLNAGKYYLAVTCTPNVYAPKYGMLGKYTVSIL
jgi:hypothetical protein